MSTADEFRADPARRRQLSEEMLILRFGEAVAQRMEQVGWDYDDLAGAAGVSRRVVVRFLEGVKHQRIRLAARLLDAMGAEVRLALSVQPHVTHGDGCWCSPAVVVVPAAAPSPQDAR